MKHIKSFNNFIFENKYPTKIVDNISKKLNDNSDKTLNMIQIFGLFRNQSPFNTTDIQQIKNVEQLENLYNEWFNNSIKKLTISGSLKGNVKTATNYLNAYVDNVRKIDIKPFSFKNAEETLIDVVNNNGWIKQQEINSLFNINNPDKKDIVYNDENILIVKGSTKSKCIMYGNGYTWCISQSNLNYYSTYRIKYKASIYFVLNKNLEKDNIERLCVILRYPKDKYGIADKSNAGNRSGGPNVAVNGFENVVRILPWLKGKEEYFKYKSVSRDEKTYQNSLEEHYGDNDLGDYIKETCSLLTINGEKVEPVDFLRDYVAYHEDIGNYVVIDKYQIQSLDYDMLEQLVEMGYTIDFKSLEYLPSNLRVRYGVLSIENSKNLMFEDYSDDELLRIFNNEKFINNKNVQAMKFCYSSNIDRLNYLKNNNIDVAFIKMVKMYCKNSVKNELIEMCLPYVKEKIKDSNIITILSNTDDNGLVEALYNHMKDYIESYDLTVLIRYSKDETFKNFLKEKMFNNTISAKYIDNVVIEYLFVNFPDKKDMIIDLAIKKLKESSKTRFDYNIFFTCIEYVDNKITFIENTINFLPDSIVYYIDRFLEFVENMDDRFIISKDIILNYKNDLTNKSIKDILNMNQGSHIIELVKLIIDNVEIDDEIKNTIKSYIPYKYYNMLM